MPQRRGGLVRKSRLPVAECGNAGMMPLCHFDGAAWSECQMEYMQIIRGCRRRAGRWASEAEYSSVGKFKCGECAECSAQLRARYFRGMWAFPEVWHTGHGENETGISSWQSLCGCAGALSASIPKALKTALHRVLTLEMWAAMCPRGSRKRRGRKRAASRTVVCRLLAHSWYLMSRRLHKRLTIFNEVSNRRIQMWKRDIRCQQHATRSARF